MDITQISDKDLQTMLDALDSLRMDARVEQARRALDWLATITNKESDKRVVDLPAYLKESNVRLD